MGRLITILLAVAFGATPVELAWAWNMPTAPMAPMAPPPMVSAPPVVPMPPPSVSIPQVVPNPFGTFAVGAPLPTEKPPERDNWGAAGPNFSVEPWTVGWKSDAPAEPQTPGQAKWKLTDENPERQKFIVGTWNTEAKSLAQKITTTNQELASERERLARIQAKYARVALGVDANNNVIYGAYADPNVQSVVQRVNAKIQNLTDISTDQSRRLMNLSNLARDNKVVIGR